jgi:hypothetical protein
MRRIILLLFLITGVLAACSRGEPQIAVEITQLDLGDVPNGEIAARDVVVRNDGAGTLLVEGVSTSCGCTSATLEPMRLEPGEQGTLHVEYDAGAHGPGLRGSQLRQVFIASNDPAQPELIVELSVNVTEPTTSN